MLEERPHMDTPEEVFGKFVANELSSIQDDRLKLQLKQKITNIIMDGKLGLLPVHSHPGAQQDHHQLQQNS